jgi:hypothetical protein
VKKLELSGQVTLVAGGRVSFRILEPVLSTTASSVTLSSELTDKGERHRREAQPEDVTYL